MTIIEKIEDVIEEIEVKEDVGDEDAGDGYDGYLDSLLNKV
jgi:hypothetical protein